MTGEDSWACSASSDRGRPKNVRNTSRPMYSAEMQRPDDAEDEQPRVPGVVRHLEDLVLREEPRERVDTGQRQRADHERDAGDGHPPQQPAHLLHVRVVVHPVHHRPGAQEHQRLVERVRDEHEQRDRVRPQSRRDEHEPELADRGVREHALDVVLTERARPGEEHRDDTDDRDDGERHARDLEDHVHPQHQVHAGGHHRGRVDERRDRASDPPWRRGARRAAAPARTCRPRRRTAAARSRSRRSS